jgi:hypothetical protein
MIIVSTMARSRQDSHVRSSAGCWFLLSSKELLAGG